MNYCKRCVLPDTRPGIILDDEGVCSACRGHEDKKRRIDWTGRAKVFEGIVADAKARSTGYDCIVPVSGGKDSWYQVIRCQEEGLKILGVTWRTPARTPIGQRNLDRMINHLGIDHIDYSISPEVEKRFTKAAFVRKGATAIPMHMALFAIPIRLAVQMRIPLVVWGENPQLEFGGPEADRLATELGLDWVKRYGVTNGTSWSDWVSDDLSEQDMVAYRLPKQEAFEAFAPTSIFLGSFFEWDSFHNAGVASKHGFESGEGHLKTGLWEFADLDCDFISLHHFLKWYKFGIQRSFDNLSVQIRYGLITREQAIETLRRTGMQVPQSDIQRFCAFVGEPAEWFWKIAETFRDTDIWKRDDSGTWFIPNFIIDDWNWRI